jgi:hypothetical protein
MREIQVSLRSVLALLVWTKTLAESRVKQGKLSWVERQTIDAFLACLNSLQATILEQIEAIKQVSEVKGVFPGGFITLSERGRVEYKPVLAEEVDSELQVLSVKPFIAVSPSGVKVQLNPRQIAVE